MIKTSHHISVKDSLISDEHLGDGHRQGEADPANRQPVPLPSHSDGGGQERPEMLPGTRDHNGKVRNKQFILFFVVFFSSFQLSTCTKMIVF